MAYQKSTKRIGEDNGTKITRKNRKIKSSLEGIQYCQKTNFLPANANGLKNLVKEILLTAETHQAEAYQILKK